MKVAVLTFPGSNCDNDLIEALRDDFSASVDVLWHTNTFVPTHDFYFVPGGFSYGDYLRTGALAAQAKSLGSLRSAAKEGRPILGICNGFQILCEAKLLPGVLIRNKEQKYICEWTPLKADGFWQGAFPENFHLPISHGEGNFICSPEEMEEIKQNGQAFLRYKENPNGAMHDIAGVTSKNKRIFGLMPHPERAIKEQKDNALSKHKFGRLFFEKLFSGMGV
ncbi:MAG: Phosphoribosylformylglycinamidine synthase subunit PurQ [Turneriella sp.]|nr:Phosphoribosylformylglycinamidine synthase subunit PurQ [Turneriella sp.]